MSVNLTPEIQRRILDALACGEKAENTPFLRIAGRAQMRYDNVVIFVAETNKIVVEFHWRGKMIMHLDNILSCGDRLNISMEGAMEVWIE